MVTMVRKRAVILLSGLNEWGRAFHALVYTKDLSAHGNEPRLFFDGPGTQWLDKLLGGGEGLRPIFDELQEDGLVEAACNSCSTACKTADAAKAPEVSLTAEGTHVAVGELARAGYDVIVV